MRRTVPISGPAFTGPSTQPRCSPGWYRRSGVALTAAALTCLGVLLPLRALPAAAELSPTVVSLTFDDGRATQYTAREILASYGMHGTFYVNSPMLSGGSWYLTWAQVQDLHADGNEIGGHTAYHAKLTGLDTDEAAREVCDDRVNLLNHGIDATSFAYPYGAYNPGVEQVVEDCGYNSARTVNGFAGAAAETIPPRDPYAIGQVDGSTTATALQNAVAKAQQNGGGWVPITFHDICDGCSTYSITPSDFGTLLEWLQQQAANGVTVQTVQQVIGGPNQASVPGPPAPAPPNGSSTIRNSSLEIATTAGRAPDCWQFDVYGKNSYTWTRTTDSHSGSYAQRIAMSNYQSGDGKLLSTQDLGSCAPSVTPGHRYAVSEWYKSDVPVSFSLFKRDSQWRWRYWATSPQFPASAGWAQATWTTAAVPADVTAVSFGLTIQANGSLTVDDVSMDDAAPTGSPDTTPPTVALTSPASGSIVSGAITVAATASDDTMVDHVDFLVDGTTVATTVAGPTATIWDSRYVSDGDHTISARAVDTAGNTTTTDVDVTVSNEVENLLKNPSLETLGANGVPTCWMLGAFRPTYHTAVWTPTADAHSASWAENVTITDYTGGDRKLVNSQDSGTCAPAATPGHTYTISAWYKSTISPFLIAYYRNSAGSWVTWRQWSVAASSSWRKAESTTLPLPAGATRLSVGMGIAGAGSLTMDDFALFDNGPGDTTPPTTTISCGDPGGEGSCDDWFAGPVSVTLTASDNPGGSGVAKTVYTTDGTDPTSSHGTTYTGPFSTTSAVKYRSYDKAGNAEPIQTQAINIDNAPPETSLDSTPPAMTTSTSATFAFSSEPGASFACRLDGGQPTECTAPVTYTGLSEGSHTFDVAATDTVGNVDPTPASYSWTVDLTPPQTTLAPKSVVGTDATFTFTADEPGSTFECSLDASKWAACNSPVEHTEIGVGGHTFQVRATDPAGNVDPTPASYDWVATEVTLTVTPRTQQYSDKVSLRATVLPAAATGTVQFRLSTDGATYTDIGGTQPVTDGVAVLPDPAQILEPAGASVKFRAEFTGTGDYADSADTATLAVIEEDAAIAYAGSNPVAVQVSAEGSGSWTGTLSFAVALSERAPDVAGTGSATAGDITRAGLSMSLVPVAGGSPITLTCTAGAVSGTGYAQSLPYVCGRATTVPLGTYEVVADVTGDYYSGHYMDAFTVYDPSLGFATGGGSYLLDGDKVNFGFTMKYNKSKTNLQGNLIAVRHHPDGTVSRMKSNALGGLAIQSVAGCGVASFNGKSTYTRWDPTENSPYGDYVTVGNQPFAVYGQDCSNPGTGTDKMWMMAPGDLDMGGNASTNSAMLIGGNITVPH